MSSILLVPIQVDALHLKFGTAVAQAFAEFNRLPFFNQSKRCQS